MFEDLLREGGGGGRDRGRALADRGLDASPATRVERHPEDPVEQRSRGPCFERIPHLPENLALARDHRVEPRCDAEQVEGGRLVRQTVRDRCQRARGGPGQREERAIGPFRETALVLLGCDVELRAVARREHDRLEPLRVRQLARERRRAVEVDRDALAELQRSPVVRDAGEREPHDAKWVRGSTIATSAAPPTSSQAKRRPCRPASRRSRSANP